MIIALLLMATLNVDWIAAAAKSHERQFVDRSSPFYQELSL